MNALHRMDRYGKEVIQVSTLNNDIKVQYLYDNMSGTLLNPCVETKSFPD